MSWQSSKGLRSSNRSNCWSGQITMTRNIKETFLPKSGMWKSNFLQDLGYVKGMCCMLHAMLQGSVKYPKLKVSKEIKTSIIYIQYNQWYACRRCQKFIWFTLRFSNTKYSNYMKLSINGLNYNRVRIRSLNYNKLQNNTSNKRHFQ